MVGLGDAVVIMHPAALDAKHIHLAFRDATAALIEEFLPLMSYQSWRGLPLVEGGGFPVCNAIS